MRRLLPILVLASRSLSAADPDIVVDNSTGSDTGASGAPSSFGAQLAVASCNTGGVASTTITVPVGHCTGIPVDGSAALWLATGSGRRWSKITGTGAGTITVEDSFNIAAPGVDCACGGKRASISASRQLQDLKAGWTVSVEATGSDYSQAVALPLPGGAVTGTDRWRLRGTGGRPKLVWTADTRGLGDAAASGARSCYIENFEMVNTAGTKVNAFAIQGQTSFDLCVVRNVIFDGWRQVFTGNGTHGLIYQCEAKNSATRGFGGGSTWSTLFLANYSHNNTGEGFGDGNAPARSMYLYNISANNAGVGLTGIREGAIHNTLVSNGGNGMANQGVDGGVGEIVVGNLSTNNTGAGYTAVPAASADLEGGKLVNNNAFFANAGGSYSANAPVGPNDTTGVSPAYVNAAGQNWSLSPATGLLNLGWPPTLTAMLGTTMQTGTEPGASQRSGAGSANYAY